MSQVTRCPSCATRFKVVADQLRISQGWVRCGVCQEVFDASEDLSSLPDEEVVHDSAPLATSPVEGLASEVVSAELDSLNSPELIANSEKSVRAVGGYELTADDAMGDESPLPDGVDSDTAEAPSEPSDTDEPPLAKSDFPIEDEASSSVESSESEQPAEDIAESRESSFVDLAQPLPQSDLADEHGEQHAAESSSEPESALTDDVVDSADSHGKLDETEAALPAPEVSSETDADAAAEDVHRGNESSTELAPQEALAGQDVAALDEAKDVDAGVQAEEAVSSVEAEPSFVRQARRKAFWSSKAVRAGLLLSSLIAVGAVAGQIAWQQRDSLAVQYPVLQPALKTLCSVAGCELQPRREISDVFISSSGFKQLADPHQYQWSLSLENRSDLSVATPMAELTLTDAQDKTLLRRVIPLQPLGAPAQLQGREEWSVSVPVQLQDLSAPVVGYRALVFYP